MIYKQYDEIVPVYSEVNNKVCELLKVEKIHLAVYEVQLVRRLNNYHKLYISLDNLEKKFGHSSMYVQNRDRLLKSINNLEIEIFNFLKLTKNPYFFLLTPYYRYGQGLNFANVKEVSDEFGYLKEEGTGIKNAKLASKYALYTLGIYNPKELDVANDKVEYLDPLQDFFTYSPYQCDF